MKNNMPEVIWAVKNPYGDDMWHPENIWGNYATRYVREAQLAARDAVIEEYAKTFHSLDFVLANALNEMSAAYSPDHSRACGYAQLQTMRRIIGETLSKIEGIKSHPQPAS